MDQDEMIPSHILTLLEDLHADLQDTASAVYQLALEIESGTISTTPTSRESTH